MYLISLIIYVKTILFVMNLVYLLGGEFAGDVDKSAYG